MITSKELFDKMLQENDECTSTEMMIEFAKIHVTEALKKASESTLLYDFEKEIFESYSLDNIV
jgi:hypothetical protein